jgi:hypothetical protein
MFVFKQCACGRTYTKEQWDELPHRREWAWPWGEIQELRDCSCGSTLCIVLVEGEPEGKV